MPRGELRAIELTEGKEDRSRRERQLHELPLKSLRLRTHGSAVRSERVQA